MNDMKNTFPLNQILVTILIVSYFAGYAVIRANCKEFLSGYFKVPSCIAPGGSMTSLYILYKPLFFAERLCTGHQFHSSGTPWSMPGPSL